MYEKLYIPERIIVKIQLNRLKSLAYKRGKKSEEGKNLSSQGRNTTARDKTRLQSINRMDSFVNLKQFTETKFNQILMIFTMNPSHWSSQQTKTFISEGTYKLYHNAI